MITILDSTYVDPTRLILARHDKNWAMFTWYIVLYLSVLPRALPIRPTLSTANYIQEYSFYYLEKNKQMQKNTQHKHHVKQSYYN